MKTKALLLIATVAFLGTVACNQKQNATPGADVTRVPVTTSASHHSSGRLVTSAYSKSISIDTANRMIKSYLESVGYPNTDSAVRSLAFDADTLRNYLTNSNITSVEFFFAHQQAYLNADGTNFGRNIGMRPGALTIICVGFDDNGNIVRNSSNGVYEHGMPCPYNCPSSTYDGFLH